MLLAGDAACKQIMSLMKVQAYSFTREGWFEATVDGISEKGAMVSYDVGGGEERTKEIEFEEISEYLKPTSESTPELLKAFTELPDETIKWYVAAVLDELFMTSEFSGKVASKQLMNFMQVRVHDSCSDGWLEASLDTISESSAVARYDAGSGEVLRKEIPLATLPECLKATSTPTPELFRALAAFPNESIRRCSAAVLDKLFQTSEFSAVLEPKSSSGVVLGSKVSLSAAGCVVQDDYKWDDDALAPGDVGEVIKVDRFDGSWVKIVGPSGRQNWYEQGHIEIVTVAE
eukprot:TRINITY_DN108857_c0_g1_i1.p1 TRINITY_DN108857_c0_g1~~TRINITY_DN108857_c0_g1_i1.p1  ORF type:complete len:320 (-),score=73.42 TRINITY_DN108857_c0_g1_i1:16-882(-)